ncbi:replication initiation factor domain-containing protein [Staphylococcus simulans]|uniref:replication initiation factor domain-containing protein n=1 Tax=Staphylococcus simulans TaxID=1286 RepID=UPI000D1E4188|nr:replication initiation factor domain-containing protein [Staphylococcus simulans]PTJ91006.1 replication initiation factor domain-containing protein [Staphylococcus simulans]
MVSQNHCPPLTNRGVASPKESRFEAVVDWVQVTFHVPPVSVIIEDIIGLPMALFKKRDNGIYFYNRGYEFSNIKLYYSDDNESMGVHLQLTGAGCREFEYHLKQLNQTWQMFFEKCLHYQGNFTRIDIAIDDFKTYLKVPSLIKKAERGECISKFRAGSSINGFNLADGKSKGATFYIGSKKSNIYCRFYEKNYEQAFKRNCDVEEIGPWNRYEIQMRKTYAVNCAEVLSRTDNIGEIVKSILNHNLKFVSPPKDSSDQRKRRWPLYRPWALFIKGTDKLSLSMRPTIKSIEDNMEWLCKQVATTLDTVLTAEMMAQSEGLLKDTDFLEKILAHSRFNDEHSDRISHYLESLKRKKHLS